MTPFPEKENLTTKQIEFNKSLTSAYLVTSKTFGYLKGRFQRLQHNLENRSFSFAVKCIQAACVLHNICMQNADDCPFFVQDNHNFQNEPETAANHKRRLVAFKSFLDSNIFS